MSAMNGQMVVPVDYVRTQADVMASLWGFLQHHMPDVRAPEYNYAPDGLDLWLIMLFRIYGREYDGWHHDCCVRDDGRRYLQLYASATAVLGELARYRPDLESSVKVRTICEAMRDLPMLRDPEKCYEMRRSINLALGTTFVPLPPRPLFMRRRSRSPPPSSPPPPPFPYSSRIRRRSRSPPLKRRFPIGRGRGMERPPPLRPQRRLQAPLPPPASQQQQPQQQQQQPSRPRSSSPPPIRRSPSPPSPRSSSSSSTPQRPIRSTSPVRTPPPQPRQPARVRTPSPQPPPQQQQPPPPPQPPKKAKQGKRGVGKKGKKAASMPLPAIITTRAPSPPPRPATTFKSVNDFDEVDYSDGEYVPTATPQPLSRSAPAQQQQSLADLYDDL